MCNLLENQGGTLTPPYPSGDFTAKMAVKTVLEQQHKNPSAKIIVIRQLILCL